MFDGGIHKLHSSMNLQNIVFTFLVPSIVHCYEKVLFLKKKEKNKKRKRNTSFTLCLLEVTSKGKKKPQPIKKHSYWIR